MRANALLSLLSSPEYWQSKRVHQFAGQEFAPFFWDQLFTHLKQVKVLPGSLVRAGHKDWSLVELTSQLSQSFLGQGTVWWLGDMRSFSPADRKNILGFLSTYEGPHTVAYFIEGTSGVDNAVSLPDVVDSKDFEALHIFFAQKPVAAKRALIRDLFAERTSLTLDTACLISTHLQVTSPRDRQEFSLMVSRLTRASAQLSQLSQAFFARDAKTFFSEWRRSADDYSVHFWIAFWADQLFRAFAVVGSMKRRDYSGARRSAYRLPFSFAQRLWQTYSCNELSQRFSFVYTIDSAAKSGSSFRAFDLFFLQHFSGAFD